MIRALPLALGVLLLGPSARADDFSGFYAGMNAGYGWSRDETHGTASAPVAGPSASRSGASTDLPPSASAAAEGLRRPTVGRSTRAADGR